MTEQIMQILPDNIKLFLALKEDHQPLTPYAHGVREGANGVISAIEKANLVRCPTEEEILSCISAVCQCSSCVTCRESAKALIALLHSAQKTHSSGKKYDDTDHEID